MKTLRLLPLLCWLASLVAPVHAAPAWQDALRAMPLPADAPLFSRDNAVAVLLPALRSNDTVKALLFLPEVFDDFYLIHRDAPKLNLRATNLFDALTKLTNATDLRLTWREPFLLAHLADDRLEPSLVSDDAEAARRLKSERPLSHALFADLHWERLQPRLASAFKLKLQPAPDSQDAWHFARHNFAAWNLTGWELLSALSLSGNTTVTVENRGIVFRERLKR